PLESEGLVRMLRNEESEMQVLDGNAIGGSLWEAFGREMTGASGACAYCGTASQIAELVVYQRAPGSVVGCRCCGSVVMVLVRARPHQGALRVHLRRSAARAPNGADRQRLPGQ